MNTPVFRRSSMACAAAILVISALSFADEARNKPIDAPSRVAAQQLCVQGKSPADVLVQVKDSNYWACVRDAEGHVAYITGGFHWEESPMELNPVHATGFSSGTDVHKIP